MRKATLIPVLFAALAGGALGFGLGSLSRSDAGGGLDSTSAPSQDLEAEMERLRQENELLTDSLVSARRRIAEFEASAPEPEAVDPSEPPMGPVKEEPEKTDEERAAEKAAALRDLESIEYQLTGDPTNPDLLARLLVSAARAGEIDRAVATLEDLAKKHPENPDIHSQLGRAYLFKIRTIDNQMEQGRYAFSAVGEFTRALESDPEHFGARLNRGVTNLHMPDFLKKDDEAIHDLEKLVDQGGGRGDDDRYASAYAWLTRAYRKAGRDEDAKKTLDEGMRLFPDDPNLLRVVNPR